MSLSETGDLMHVGLIIAIVVMAIIAIVITSVYALKNGKVIRLNDEKVYLETLNTSTSCKCT